MNCKLVWSVVILLSLVVCIHGRPSPGDSTAAATNGCNPNCPGYDPVCGTDDKGVNETFNNVCSLESSNCMKKTTYQKVGDGPCP